MQKVDRSPLLDDKGRLPSGLAGRVPTWAGATCTVAEASNSSSLGSRSADLPLKHPFIFPSDIHARLMQIEISCMTLGRCLSVCWVQVRCESSRRCKRTSRKCNISQPGKFPIPAIEGLIARMKVALLLLPNALESTTAISMIGQLAHRHPWLLPTTLFVRAAVH